jgi:hypothetical protein
MNTFNIIILQSKMFSFFSINMIADSIKGVLITVPYMIYMGGPDYYSHDIHDTMAYIIPTFGYTFASLFSTLWIKPHSFVWYKQSRYQQPIVASGSDTVFI